MDRLLTNVHNLDKRPMKQFKGKNDDITFRDSDAHLIHHPYYDALVITIMMASNKVHKILVDNGSSVDILYYQAFQKMDLKVSDLKLSPNPVYGFTGDSVTPMGVISLPMTVGDYPTQSCVMANFLVIDQPSAFNVVLGRPSLKALKAITSIYHLLMKFPTPSSLGKVQGNQDEARRCCNQAIRNISRPQQANIIHQQPPSDGPLDDTINPRLSNEEAITAPIEDLVDLLVDDNEPSKVLKLGKSLPNEL